MVAAAKLRRAQEAAEARAPVCRAVQAVMAGLARPRWVISDGAPAVVRNRQRQTCTSGGHDRRNAGLCGGFNANIAKRAHMRKSCRERRRARRSRSRDRRQERPRLALNAARPRDNFIEHVDLSGVKRAGLRQMHATSPRMWLERFDAGEFDVATIFFLEVRKRGDPESRRPADHPRSRSRPTKRGSPGSALRLRAERRGDSGRPAAALRGQDVFRRCWKTASEQGARMSAMDNATATPAR